MPKLRTTSRAEYGRGRFFFLLAAVVVAAVPAFAADDGENRIVVESGKALELVDYVKQIFSRGD